MEHKLTKLGTFCFYIPILFVVYSELILANAQTLKAGLAQVQNGQYVAPRIKNSKILTPASKQAVNELIAFLGYQGNAGRGSFIQDSPANILLSADSSLASVTINGTPITKKQLVQAQKSISIYADDNLSMSALRDTLLIKSVGQTSNRRLKKQTKYLAEQSGRRVILSTDFIINGADFKPLDKPYECITIAASAPNLKPKGNNQRNHFVINGRLDEPKFKKEIKSRIELILKAMHEQGVTYPIFPAIGAGDFSAEFGQKVARLTAKAIREELETNKYKNFKGVIFSMIGGPQEQNYKAYTGAFKNYSALPPAAITELEMTAIAIHFSKIDEMPGYVIADAPTRRPGNGWAINEDGTGARAQEETAAKHLAAYILAQSHELNPKILDPIIIQKVVLVNRSNFQTLASPIVR